MSQATRPAMCETDLIPEHWQHSSALGKSCPLTDRCTPLMGALFNLRSHKPFDYCLLSLSRGGSLAPTHRKLLRHGTTSPTHSRLAMVSLIRPTAPTPLGLPPYTLRIVWLGSVSAPIPPPSVPLAPFPSRYNPTPLTPPRELANQ